MLSDGAKRYLFGEYLLPLQTIYDAQFFQRKYFRKDLEFRSHLRYIARDLVGFGDVMLNSRPLLQLEKDLLEVKEFLQEQDRYQLRCFKTFRHYLWTCEHVRAFHELNKFSSRQDKRIEYIRDLKARVMEASTFLGKFVLPQQQNGTQEQLREALDQMVYFW